MLEAHSMTTNGLVRFIVMGIVLLLVISIGGYFLFRPSTTPPPNEAVINAIYQVVGEFGARLRNVPTDTLQSLEALAAKKGIGVHVVNGVKMFRMKDGQDLPIALGMDGKDYVSDHGESSSLKTMLEWQLGLPVGGEVSSSAEEDSGQLLPPIPAVDSNLRRLITDHLYQKFAQDTSTIPGKPAEGPWPDRIQIDSVQKLDNTSYTVNGKIILMTSLQTAEGGNAGEKPITLTVKNVNGIWLIDDVT
jgi:hypothetical protein